MIARSVVAIAVSLAVLWLGAWWALSGAARGERQPCMVVCACLVGALSVFAVRME